MLSLLSILFFTFQLSFAQYPEPLPYEYQLTVHSDYFTSTENLNNEGKKISLINGGKFTNLTTRSALHYNWLDNLQVLAGGDFAYSQSTLANEDRSNLNFSEVFAGAKYFYRKKNLSLVSDLLATLTLSEVDPYGDEVLMSDQAHSLNLGVWSIYEAKNFFPYAYLGTKLMSDERAWLYILRLGLKYQFSGFSVYGEVANSAPFKDDKNISVPQNRWFVTDRVNGGSYKFYSVNPELTEFSLGSDFTVSESIKLGVQLKQPISGRRVANGLSVLFGLSMDFGSTAEVRDILKNKKIAKPKTKDTKKEFREQTEDEDQELFEETK